MSSTDQICHIMLTGLPGIGKTTIIQKVSQELLHNGVCANGFYTSELREGGRRVGFNIISLDGIVKPLARIGDASGPRVGQYVVKVQSFESVALPILESSMNKVITVIDEIGKMELFSRSFESAVRRAFTANSTILGTIPLQKGKPMQIVEFIRSHPTVKLVTVTKQNRDHLVSEIVNHLQTILKEKESS